MSALEPVVQNIVGVTSPQESELLGWLEFAAHAVGGSGEVALRIVDEAESKQLNSHFRGREAPTNVLSFGVDPQPGVAADDLPDILGDIVICAPLVSREAREQGKTEHDHWAHLVVHGVLHLVGYDHERGDEEAKDMEDLERAILAKLGVADPYSEEVSGGAVHER